MKHKNTYGSLSLTAQTTAAIQLEWEMVEPAPSAGRFLNFPCVGAPVGTLPVSPRRRRSQKHRLAA